MFTSKLRYGLFVLIVASAFEVFIQETNADQHENFHHGQVHLSLGSHNCEIVVTWTTEELFPGDPMVSFGKKDSNVRNFVHADKTEFRDKESHFFTFRAILPNLEPNMEYEYQVGSKQSNWSPTHHFRSLKVNGDILPRFAIFGDLGLKNGRSIPFLKKDVENSMYDVLFHIGDIAYNLHERKGHQGHDYMSLVEPIASRVPYMTCPGNHEEFGNFSHYDARFTMLSERVKSNGPISHRINNHYYSFDLGPAHIIMFSSEYYFYPKYYGTYHMKKQFAWLKEDLKKANQNRKKHPWIIAMAHRPMYCFNCDNLEHAEIRLGLSINGTQASSLEELFYKNGVDLQFYGHEHHYARTYPVYKMKLESHIGNNTYFHDSKAPIHYTTGSGGCREDHTDFRKNLTHVKFLGFHRLDYGYTRLTFLDKLKIKLDQTSVDHEGKVMDSIQISKSQFEPAWMHS